jgi:cell division septation protein DedD
MSRDYKPAPQKTSSKGSPFFTGLLIGLLMGVGLSVWLTMYLKGGDNPFTDKKLNRPNIENLSGKISPEENSDESALPQNESPDNAKPDNKFDFYTILPETESTVTEKEIKESSLTVKKDNYFLQVGAFQNEADADNMKAKLALQGFEAVVQTATIPEKGVWHRVRVGPLNDITQINKVRGDLTTNGFNTDLIKVHTETKPG